MFHQRLPDIRATGGKLHDMGGNARLVQQGQRLCAYDGRLRRGLGNDAIPRRQCCGDLT